MASVTPADNSYQYYQKRASELEEEFSEDRKKSNARQEEQIARVEDNYKRILKERDAKTEEVVENQRNRTAETSRNTQEHHRAEVERLKAANYDKFGRFGGADADTVKAQLKSAMETNQGLQDRQAAREKDVESAYQDRLENGGRDAQARMEDAVKRTKEETQSGYETSAQNAKAAAIDQEVESKKRYEALNTERIAALNEARRTSQKQMDDVRLDYENQKATLNASVESRLEKQSRMTGKGDEAKVRAINDSHNEQTHGLHEQISELLSHEKDYMKGKATGRADAIREYDNEWREKAALADEAYASQLQNQKVQSRDSDDHASRVNREVLRDKENGFAQRAAQQTLEHHQESRMYNEQNQIALDAQHKQMVKQRESSDQHLAERMAEANDERASALAGQGATFQATSANQNASNRAEMERLEAQLQYRNTSGDINSVSPAAEATIRRSVDKQYRKTMDAELERNKRSEESIQRSYADRLSDHITETGNRHTALNRNQETEHHLEKRALMDYIGEVTTNRDASLQKADRDQGRQSDLKDRNFARMSEAQRQEYENILTNQRMATSDQVNSLRQEKAFKEREAMRNHSNAQNELIHDYEKKLFDQKTEYETQMDSTRAQSRQELHESEHRSKQLLEDQMRGYEQRISQLESAYKERERALTENYREQMERVRRNHELQQKKS